MTTFYYSYGPEFCPSEAIFNDAGKIGDDIITKLPTATARLEMAPDKPEDLTPGAKLTDFAVSRILNLLEIDNLAAASLVNRQWNRLGREVWKSKTIVSLSDTNLHNKPFDESAKTYSFVEFLQKQLSQKLTHLSLSGSSFRLTLGDVQTFGENFQGLTSLILGDSRHRFNPMLSENAILGFKLHFSQLEKLSMDTCFKKSRYSPQYANKFDKQDGFQQINAYFSDVFLSPNCLRNLKSLSLRCNDVLSGTFLPAIKAKLSSIDLSQCGNLQEPSLLEFLQKQKSLKAFIFQGHPKDQHAYAAATKAVVSAVLYLQNMEKVDFSHLRGWLSSVTPLTRCPILKEFRIQNSLLFTDNDLQRVFKYCRTSLEVASLSRVRCLTISSVCCLAKCQTLKQIHIGGCRLIDDEVFCRFVHCPLTDVSIPKTRITDKSLAKLAANCADSLRFLNVDNCLGVTATGIQAILDRCQNLATCVIPARIRLGELNYDRDVITVRN